MDKQTYDLRGSQSLLSGLFRFDTEAYLHMIFYRILIWFSFIAAAIFIFDYFFKINALSHAFFLLVWIFFTPQVLESAKGLSVIGTKGFVFGYLNKSYLTTAGKYEKQKMNSFYKVLPYIVFALWISGFVVLSFEWLI